MERENKTTASQDRWTNRSQNEKELIQARHCLEEALARDRVKERKLRTRRLIVHGAVLEKVAPVTRDMDEKELQCFLEQQLARHT